MGILELGGFFGIVWLILVLYAVVRTLRSTSGDLGKAIWIAILLFFPIGGLILWAILGPDQP
jgi:hypothetical protein